jgi:hypothetical protein
VHTGFWCGDLREGDILEDVSIDGSIILKWIFKKWRGGARTRLIWLSIRTGPGIFVNEVMNFLVPYDAGNFRTSFSRRALLHGVSLFIYSICNWLYCVLYLLLPPVNGGRKPKHVGEGTAFLYIPWMCKLLVVQYETHHITRRVE